MVTRRETLLFAGLTLLPGASGDFRTLAPTDPLALVAPGGAASRQSVFAAERREQGSHGAPPSPAVPGSGDGQGRAGDFRRPPNPALRTGFGFRDPLAPTPAAATTQAPTLEATQGAGHGWRVDAGERVAGASGGISPTCQINETGARLDAGNQYWAMQSRSVTPTWFPAGVRDRGASGRSDPLDLGPVGPRSNVPGVGPAGAWCRPNPVSTSESDPLERPAIFVPLGSLSIIALIFWLTRGPRMPS